MNNHFLQYTARYSSLNNSVVRVILFFGAVFLSFIAPLSADAMILSVSTRIEVGSDARMVVREEILYASLENATRHERCFSRTHQDAPTNFTKYRYRDIVVSDVAHGDVPITYTTTDEDNRICVTYDVSPSSQESPAMVTLSYEIMGGLTYVENGGAEVYFRIATDDFGESVRNVRAEVYSAGVSFAPEKSCYHGLPGKHESCRIQTEGDSNPVFIGNLDRRGEEMIIAQGVSRNGLAIDIRESVHETAVLALVLFGTFAILSIFFGIRPKNSSDVPVRVQYEPPEGISPLVIGALLTRRVEMVDILAHLVSLAERGVIHFRYAQSSQNDINLFATLQTYTNDELLAYDRSVLKMLFGEALSVGVEIELVSPCKEKRQEELRAYLRETKEHIRSWLSRDGLLTYFSFKTIHTWWWMLLLFFAGVLLSGISVSMFVVLSLCVLMIMCSVRYGIRTRRGARMRAHLLEFREYVRVPSAQRFILHNAPQMSAHHYVAYLPFSIALESNAEWTHSFVGTVCTVKWISSITPVSVEDIERIVHKIADYIGIERGE